MSGAPAWTLAWALVLACALPWLLPETWDGQVAGRWIALGWALVLVSALLLRWRRWAWLPLVLVLPWGTLGALRQRARWERQLPAGFVELEGSLDAPWTLREDQWLGRLKVLRPSTLAGCSLPLSLPSDSETPLPAPGTPVRLRAELRPVLPAPAFIGERPLWRARSDEAPRRLRLPSAQLFERLGPPRPSPILRLQLWAHGRFEALPLEGMARDLWGALALGIPPASEDRASVFAESGTLHILVVSGLQMTLIIAFAEALLRRLLRKGASIGAVATGIAYACIVGFSAPVWRGLLMGSAWALGRASGWRLPPVLGLHLALLLWLMGHPAAGCEPGFLLAWGALLGLMWGAEPLAGLLSPLLGRLALPLTRLAAPWLATLPLLALLHGGAPTWGLVSNLLVLPAITVLTPLCLALTLLPLPGAAFVGHGLDFLGGRLVPALVHVTPLAAGHLWPWIALALSWLALAQLHAGLRRTRALTLLMVAASFALLARHGIGAAPGSLSLEAVDIGQGDALLLRQPGGDATLVDTGPSPWAARRLVRVLSRRGVREPIHLVLTHPHGDHAGGWATLSRLWPLEDATGPALADAEDPWAPYRPTAPMRLGTALRGDRWQRGETELSARWPPKPFALPDANMVSLVLRARWRDRELWLMGDALQVQERDLLDLGEPGRGALHRALKVGHHGSRSSSDPAWIAAVKPEAAIIPAGRANRFEHPHPETRATLDAAQVPYAVVGERRGLRLEAVEGGWRLEGGDGLSTFLPFRTPAGPAAPR